MAKKKDDIENKEEKIELNSEEIITEEKIEEKKEIKEEKKEPREILANEFIEVRSVTEGSLSYLDPRTKMKYVWNQYGAIQSMTFESLLSLNASSPAFLTTPLVVVDDKDVAEKLHITYIYNDFDFEVADNLDKFFKFPIEEMRKRIRKLPDCIKENIKVKARSLYKNGTLSDLNRIKMLEQELKIDLSVLADD